MSPVAWRPVLAIAGGVVALLLAVAGRYGWHRDELYFVEAGRHLAWGYVDQPPLTPLMARAADLVAPGDLVVLRVLPALATGVTLVVAALLARELGASRRGQVLAAGAMAASGFVLGAGHLLSTATFDLTASLALLWLAARLLRTGDTRLWLAIGGVGGVAMLNKSLIVLVGLAVLAGLAAERRWELLRTRRLVAGGALALLIAAPNLIWQAGHGWPQVEMAEAISDRIGAENRATLVPFQLLYVGPLLAGVLWAGARRLRATPDFRPLLWAWPAMLAVVLISGGRPYYALPLTVTVLIAGIAAVERSRWPAPLLAVSAVVAAVVALPLLPRSAVEATSAVNEAAAETIGWPELAGQVAAVVRGLPAGERRSVVLLTATYGEAGALDRFGPERGLPRVYSGHNGYADFRRPDDDRATVVAVRYRPETLAPYFDRCEQVATVGNSVDVDNEVHGAPIVVCRGLRGTWAAVWPRLRHYS